MTAILAHWEQPAALQEPGAQKKLFVRWSHTCKAFGVTELNFVETTPMPDFGDQEITLRKFPSLEKALEELPGEMVFVQKGGDPIETFSFPDDPFLVFGSDYGQLPKSDLSLNTDIPIHADVACGIILHWIRNGA